MSEPGQPLFDGLDYMTYPERRGFPTRLDVNGFDRLLLVDEKSKQSLNETLALVQSWLFFGCLHVALGVLGVHWREQDFMQGTAEDNMVTTAPLLELLGPLPTGFASLLYKRNARSILNRLCCHLGAQVQDLEMAWPEPQRTESPFIEVMLSIRVLAWTLASLAPEMTKHHPWDTIPATASLRPSMLPIFQRMSAVDGWCPHQTKHLCARYDPITVLYLASSKPPAPKDHTICIQNNTCRASNIGNKSSGRHVKNCKGDDCPAVTSTNPEALYRILERGEIPVVIASKQDDKIVLKYVQMHRDTRYTAVSHVWSDGLGDPRHNHLPLCQLEKLLQRMFQTNKYRYHTSTAHRRPGQFELPSSRTLDRAKYPCKFLDYPICFWLDAYCIPAMQDDESVMRLKRKAIARMVPTYALAEQVLVLNKGLSQLSEKASPLDHVVALSKCTWRSRYWTHEELTLAGRKSVVVHFRVPQSLQRLLAITAIKGFVDELSRSKRTLSATLLQLIMSQVTSTLLESKVGAQRLREPPQTEAGPWNLNYSKWFQLLHQRRSKLLLYDEELTEPAHFQRVWHGFLGKTSSLPEDMHGILCNLLNLDVSEILSLPSNLRMRAILASYGTLLINALLSAPRSAVVGLDEGEESSPRDLNFNERWIANLPGERDEVHAPSYDQYFVRVNPGGLVCSQSMSRKTLWIEEPPQDVWRRDGWIVRVESQNERGVIIERVAYHVILICEDDGSANPWNAHGMMLFLPDMEAPVVQQRKSGTPWEPPKY